VPSYSPVYSAQFILYTSVDPTTSYEIPSGFTAVVRDFTGYSDGGASLCQLLIQNDGSAPELVVAQLSFAGIAAYAQWQGRVVVPAGGFILIQPGALLVNPGFYVGGYLLRDVAP